MASLNARRRRTVVAWNTAYRAKLLLRLNRGAKVNRARLAAGTAGLGMKFLQLLLALLLLSIVNVNNAAGTEFVRCSLGYFIRGLCTSPHQTIFSKLQKQERMCSEEEFKRGECRMHADLLKTFPLKHSCKEYYKLIGAPDNGICHYDTKASVAPTAQDLLVKGRSLFAQGRYRDAVKVLSTALRHDPKMAEAYLLRAKALLKVGEGARAIADLSDVANHGGTAELQAEAKELLPSADLSVRQRFWEEQAFYCKSGADQFPAKNDKLFDPFLRYDPNAKPSVWGKNYLSSESCDAGDMTFFNGLLCAAGDERGCHGVAIAQDLRPGPGRGRWWRAKTLIGQVDTAEQASFSTEMGLGVLNYVAATGDKDRFQAWLQWIEKNPRVYSPLPSYCTHKECVFKAIDCPLMVVIASRFNLATEAQNLCNPLEGLGIPSPDEILTRAQKAIDKLLDTLDRIDHAGKDFIREVGNAIGLPDLAKLVPSPPSAKATFDAAVKVFRDVHERIFGPELGDAAARLAEFISLVNSVVNGVEISGTKFDVDLGKLVSKDGSYSVVGSNVTIDTGKVSYHPEGEHLAAAEVFLLRNLGYSSEQLDKASAILLERDGDNPFFEYLAHGSTSRMLSLILSKCPSYERPSTVRFQWFPERGEGIQDGRGKTAWAESMYWECIFLARLYSGIPPAKLKKLNNPIDPFDLLSDPLRAIFDMEVSIDKGTDLVDAEIGKLFDKVLCHRNPNNEICKLPGLAKCGSVLQCGRDLFCKDNPSNDLCKISLPTGGSRGGPGRCSSVAECGKQAFCSQNPSNDLCKIPLSIPGGGLIPSFNF